MVIIFKAYIFGSVSVRVLEILNISSLATEVSSKEILLFLFACDIHHILISQNLIHLLVATSHGTIFDM